MRYSSAEVIRREGDETLSGEAIHEASNVVIQTPPLFDHDQARSGSAIWLVQIAMGLPAIARKSHVLSRVGLGHRAPFIAVEDAIHLPFPVLSATIFLRQPESAYAPPGLPARNFTIESWLPLSKRMDGRRLLDLSAHIPTPRRATKEHP
jgi:hypothetical protein